VVQGRLYDLALLTVVRELTLSTS